MKKNNKRLLAALLAGVLMLMDAISMAPGHIVFADDPVAAEDILLIAAAPEKTLVVTADMLDADGNLNLSGGTWDKIVIAKEVGAKKVFLNGVTAKELVVESGTDSRFEITGGNIGKCTVSAITEQKPSLRDIAKSLKAGMNLQQAKQVYETAKASYGATEAKVPTFVVSGAAEIGSIELAGNAKLDLKDSKVAEIAVNTEKATGNLKLDISNFNGNLKVSQPEDRGFKVVDMKLTDSKVDKLELAGDKTGSFLLGGSGSSVKEAVVSGEANMVLSVETEKVSVAENSNNANLVVLADVKEISVAGEGSSILIAADAVVEKAVIFAENAEVKGAGKVNAAELAEGSKAEVTTEGTKVTEGIVTEEPKPTEAAQVTAAPTEAAQATTAPTAAPTKAATAAPTKAPTAAPTSAASSSGSGSSSGSSSSYPDYPYYPSYPRVTPTPLPEPTQALPTITPTPTPEPVQEPHVHTWNREEATCTEPVKCTTCDYVKEEATGKHDYSKKVETVEATCTTDGYTEYVCVVCEKATIKQNVVPATGHTVEDWGVGEETEVKCVYGRVGICTVCKEEVTEGTITKHSNVLQVTKEATCKEAGTKAFVCSVCGTVTDEKEYTNPDAHVWDDGTDADGKKVYQCIHCDATKSVVIMGSEGIASTELEDTQVELDGNLTVQLDATVLETISSSASAGASGSALVSMSAGTLSGTDKENAVENVPEEVKKEIGDSPIYDFNLSVGGEKVSDFGEGKVTVRIPYDLKPGDDPEEVVVWYLADDGKVENITGTYSNGFVSFETSHFSYYTVVRVSNEMRCQLFGHLDKSASTRPTCTADGVTTTICQRCGKTTITAGEKATGHEIEGKVTKEATCGSTGEKKYSCKHCDYYYTEELPKTQHELELAEEKASTCILGGYKKFACKYGCGYYKSEVLDPLGHQWDRTEPNCGNGIVCKICGLADPEHPATGKHKFGTDGVCTVCGFGATCTHEHKEIQVKLAEGSKTCEDGVEVKAVCLDCGQLVQTYTSKSHITGTVAREKVDLSGYEDACGGFIALMGCACGTNKWIDFTNNLKCSWSSKGENVLDKETGIRHYKQTYTCSKCKTKVVNEYYTVQGENCTGVRHDKYEVYVADELVKTFAYERNIQSHANSYNIVKLAEGSKTCEDGVEVTTYCPDCEQNISSYTTTYHTYGVLDKVDLSEYEGTCGGFIALMGCACGQNSSVNYSGYTNCEWVFQSGSSQSKQDETTGVWHYIQTYECNKCGKVKYTREYYTVPGENCTGTYHEKISIYVAGELVKTFECERETTYHQNTYNVVELAEGSKNCTDGVEVTSYCADCEQQTNKKHVSNGHTAGLKKMLKLPEYGLTIMVNVCACGESKYVSVNGNSSWSSYSGTSYVDADGFEHTVRDYYSYYNKEIHYRLDSCIAKNKDCTGVATYQYEFYVGDTKVGSYGYTAVEAFHDTYNTVELMPGSKTCEDGVNVTRKCWDCDYTYSWTTKGHTHGLVKKIDLTKYGSTCGGSINCFGCACGYNSGYYEIKANCEFGTGEGTHNGWYWVSGDENGALYQMTYECSVTDPACGLKFVLERKETYDRTNCTSIDEEFFCYDGDRDGVYEEKILLRTSTGDYHRTGGYETEYSEKDGIAIRTQTSTCINCGKYQYVNVYADYAGTESYDYHICHWWGTDEKWWKYEYEYDFSSAPCVRKTVYSNWNGVIREESVDSGCVVHEYTSKPSCTQYGRGVCIKCGTENVAYTSPYNHYFEWSDAKGTYVCTRCGLESQNGTSGKIILEDATGRLKFAGDDTCYAAGYYNLEKIHYALLVSLVLESGETVETDITAVDDGESFVTITRASVAEFVENNGVTGSYDVMLTFLPSNASVDTEYNLVFTEK